MTQPKIIKYFKEIISRLGPVAETLDPNKNPTTQLRRHIALSSSGAPKPTPENARLICKAGANKPRGIRYGYTRKSRVD